ncbi:MAG: S1 RNA-binding domain-containing protein [Oscillospiraceae bacterium]|nr:S1 RNA-binding domain-containing protein [Oscillospiraceae bacterium]
MDIVVGEVVEGKVSGITAFGAFVTVGSGKSGLVHISEIAAEFISNVSDYLKEGQDVTVKVIGIDNSGRLNLSIKQALPPTPAPPASRQSPPPSRPQRPPMQPRAKVPVAEPTFEDKLKRFMQDSDSKMSGMKTAHQKGSKRRR